MKTSELIGAALDWAVAKCEGFDWYIEVKPTAYGPKPFVFEEHGEVSCLFQPSTRWAQGGEIIEREKIELNYDDAIGWTAAYMDVRGLVECIGSTPLIAAMRCYVASNLGDEVEIPDEVKPC